MIYKITAKQPNSKMCFVCGLKNKKGLHAAFYETDKKELIALFEPCDEHQGYPGWLHGGIAAAVLDETIGRAILLGQQSEVWGVTLELTIKYKKPVPLNIELKVVAKLTEEDKRIFKGSGKIILPGGEVAVTAEGKYLRLPIEKITDFDRELNEWRVIRSDQDPESIEIN
jgi:acyl-coenzyme A thioesterase PaaI-like protein